ncbi:hypothetical protein ACU635_58840 [[Actinomadura] parvosata]|uniref:hypothetical protein n=1 Tax=[Actinomadura] parvosata TaxID=1955412 RepID=UPI00406C56B6
MVLRTALAVTASLLLPATACSAPPADPLLKDPAQWPLARLNGLVDRPPVPEEAERALAQIRVGSYDLLAWIHPSGLCGLAGSGWSMHVDLTRSEGQPQRADGFSGPMEPAASTTHESKVTLTCTPTRMLIRVKGETQDAFVSGDAVAKPVNGGLNAVVGTPEAQSESLPGAAVTRGG